MACAPRRAVIVLLVRFNPGQLACALWISWKPSLELPIPSAVVTDAPSSPPTGAKHELMLRVVISPANKDSQFVAKDSIGGHSTTSSGNDSNNVLTSLGIACGNFHSTCTASALSTAYPWTLQFNGDPFPKHAVCTFMLT